MSELLTVQFLAWAAAKPRPVAEAREAWQSTCPMNSAWEDALSDGLVAFAPGAATAGAALILVTAAGRAKLAASGALPAAPPAGRDAA